MNITQRHNLRNQPIIDVFDQRSTDKLQGISELPLKSMLPCDQICVPIFMHTLFWVAGPQHPTYSQRKSDIIIEVQITVIIQSPQKTRVHLLSVAWQKWKNRKPRAIAALGKNKCGYECPWRIKSLGLSYFSFKSERDAQNFRVHENLDLSSLQCKVRV